MIYLKDPNAVLDYSNDYTDYLASGETISSSTWVAEGGDGLLTVASSGVGTIASAITTSPLVSAGTKGQVYTLRERIVTDQGRTDDRSHTIRVEPR